MTEQEMRDRIKEIDEERNKLREEKNEYEKYLRDKEQKREYEKRKKFVGKCFMLKEDSIEKNVKAFKITKIVSEHNRNFAECLALTNGIELNCWNEKAIKTIVIGLWCHDTPEFRSSTSDPLEIDSYEEISKDEFKTLYKEYLSVFETALLNN